MASGAKQEKAMRIYYKLLQTLDSMGWQYNKLEDELGIRYFVNGDDVPMDFVITVDSEVQMLRFVSILPGTFNEDHQIEGIIAACSATNGLPMGCFSFNMKNRKIVFVASSMFLDGEVNAGWFRRQMDYVHAIVDAYNDKFLMLAKGYIDIKAFVNCCK